MSRAASRKGDICSGHGCFPPRPSIEGSSDVFINGIEALRTKDKFDTHCCGSSCHDSYLADGSSSVNINGRPAGRIGDPVRCGSVVAQGSPTVKIGG